MSLDLDPRFTFDAFVVGPANRLAVAAARRVSDTPGTTYNPLFIYGGSGLGKTHLIGAIGHQSQRIHGLTVLSDTVEHLVDLIHAAVEAGDHDALRKPLRDAGLLLLDDVQFLAGQRQIQEELLRAWDALAARGTQVVLASDRPPQEIDGIDDRLLSRLSGGLIVDMSPPDYETRIAIARRKAEERGTTLSNGVYEALARVAFTNVRELQGALNRLIAIQDLENREVAPEDVAELLGSAAERDTDEFGEFLSDVTGTVNAVWDSAASRIADAILIWEGEGYRTRRLDNALAGTATADQAETVVRTFEQDVARLREIETTIRGLDTEARELDSPILRDPDRVDEAEGLLVTVRERQAPPPAPPPGPGLDELEADNLAVRAARAVAASAGTAYNPLYVLGPASASRSALLAAVGNALAEQGLAVAYVDGATFAEELIAAIERSRLDGWRARYRRADALVLDDLEQLAGMERGYEELFHLIDELHRGGRQLVFSAGVPPQALPFPPRLKSRLEEGLVVDLPDPATVRPEPEPGSSTPDQPEVAAEVPVEDTAPSAASPHWLMSPEKVLWEWPYAEDWIEESTD